MTIIFPPKTSLGSIQRLHNYLWDNTNNELDSETLVELYSDIDQEVYGLLEDETVEEAYVEQNEITKAKLLGLAKELDYLTTEEIFTKINSIRSNINEL